MASIFRVGVRFANRAASVKPLLESNVPVMFSACHISGRSMRAGQKLEKPAPFPYENQPFTFWASWYDRTSKRFNENTKVIVVDGPIAAGKSKFAKELAEELEMKYFPEANMDMLYINEYGYDFRKEDPKLPSNVRSFDVTNYLEHPKHRNVANFQIQMMLCRYSQYIDALAHVLSTGDGVVMDRSVYSDFVFLETMFKHGHVSKGARSVYYDIQKHTIPELLRPHLCIYLDVPVPVIMDRLKKRNIPNETKVLTEAYLTDMENIYKQQYLKNISSHAELLVYDWSDFGETEVVVEDIERIDFDRFDKWDPKCRDWRKSDDWEWSEYRELYVNDKHGLLCYAAIPRYDVEELIKYPDEQKIYEEVFSNAPGNRYHVGYNAEAGDTGVMFKTSRMYRWITSKLPEKRI